MGVKGLASVAHNEITYSKDEIVKSEAAFMLVRSIKKTIGRGGAIVEGD